MDDSQDTDRFVEHLTNHQRDLYAYIMTLMPRVQDADDVLQETNKILWMKRSEFREGTSFRAWASRIAHYQVLAHRKRQRRDSRRLSPDLVDQLAQEMAVARPCSERLLAVLVQCTNRLTEAGRALVEMRYGQSLLAREIAEKTGRSALAIRQALFVIRKDLTCCIKQTLEGKEESP